MKKINNLNEQLNRMKSLMGDGRLYGNLVDKKPINEWRIIGQFAKNSDEALELFARAEKYYDDAVKSGKVSKVPSMIDDVVKSSGQGSFETILSRFSRNLDTVDDMIKHMDEFDDVYKAVLSPKQYDSYKSFIKFASENGIENLDIIRGIESGSPYFMRFPAELNLRWVIFAQWFKKQPNSVKKEVVELLRGTPTDKIVGDVPIKGSLLDDLAKTTGNSADEVIDAVKAGDDVVDDIIKTGDDVVDDVVKTGDDVVDDVVKTSSKEGGLWGEEIFLMFKDGKLTREDALRLLKDDREAMERFLTLSRESRGGIDDIGGTIGKTGDDVGDTIGKTGDDVGGTTKGTDEVVSSGGKKVPTIKVNTPKQLLERVEEVIGKGYVGEMILVTEKGEIKVLVGEADSAKALIETTLDDLTKGMSRRQKNKFIKYFMENGGEQIEKNLSKKYFSKESVIKFLKAGIGDYGPKGNLYVGDPIWGKVLGRIERLLKIHFVTIGAPVSIYYTFRDGELTHPFFIKDGGYYGKLEKSLEDMGILEKVTELALETICKNGEEATDNMFDCAAFPAIILKRSQQVANSMDCLPEGSTTEDYRKAIWKKVNNKTLTSLMYTNNKDKQNNSQLFQDKKSKILDYIDKYLGVFGKSDTWFSISDDIIINKIAKCNDDEIREKSRNRGGDGGVTWENVKNKKGTSDQGTGTGGTEDGKKKKKKGKKRKGRGIG
jgi:hypothetical protein